ncbi:hypothetical protein PHBOTO_004540 [Pseudozyma hubeiensis]|nr:hypothetical protein PHBOTO_004540 [Pseudozyma hubeiensis]
MNLQHDVHTTPAMYDHSPTSGHIINAYKTLTLPRLALFIVAFLMAAIGVRWLQLRRAKPTDLDTEALEAQLTGLDREALDRFRLFVRLAASAYDRSSVGIIRGTHEGWRCLSNSSGRIWLWQHGPGRYAIVIRGTATFRDLGEDCRLLMASYSQHESSRWVADVNQIRQEIHTLLGENHVPFDAELIIVGHSIGAAYAECALHALREQSAYRISAVTFDSPGIPSGYRRSANMPAMLTGLISLYAPANAVNTLNRSCAERLYCCGNGGDVPLGVFVAITRSTWHLIMAVIQVNARHQLDNIQRYLASGRITRTSVERWPAYTSTVLGLLGSPPSGPRQSLKSTAQVNPAPRPRPTPPQPQSPQIVQRPVQPEIQQTELVPENVEEMVQNRPYRINADLSHWKDFLKRLRPEDHIAAICGETNQGKSSVFQALIGTFFEAGSDLIGHEANTTVTPIVALVSDPQRTRRIFLIDLPGMGAAAQLPNSEPNLFVTNSALGLVDHTKGSVRMALYVIKEQGMLDSSLDSYRSFTKRADECKLDILVVHNSSADKHPKRDEQKRKLATKLGINEEEIVQCMALSDPGETDEDRQRRRYDVTALRAEWKKFLNNVEAQEDNTGSLGDREARAAQEADSVVARLGIGTFTGLVTSGATWLPGIGWWQTIPRVGGVAAQHVAIKSGERALLIAAGPVGTVISAVWTLDTLYRNREPIMTNACKGYRWVRGKYNRLRGNPPSA